MISEERKKALEAVLNPAKTNYIYFVADGTGGHKFAATYQEHQQNVSAWRVIQKKARKKAKEETDTPSEKQVNINRLSVKSDNLVEEK